MRVLIISGANLNVLERRGKEYGQISYETLKSEVEAYAKKQGVTAEFFLSNHEGEIIEAVQNCNADGLIINAGAYSHYSLAIADALKILPAQKIEVHLTNIHKTGRHESVTGAACDGVITGLGLGGYKLALDFLNSNKN
jgi:3-dehydroquinate dehydratase-2